MTQTGTVLGTSRLHRAGAGAGPARRRAHRHLLARRRPLRAADERGAVPRRELRRGRDAAHQRAAARRFATGAPTCRRASTRRCSARWRRTRTTASRRWPTSAASSRRASPRLAGSRRGDRAGAPAAPRAGRDGAASRRGRLLAVLAALIAIGAVLAVLVLDRGTSVFSGRRLVGGRRRWRPLHLSRDPRLRPVRRRPARTTRSRERDRRQRVDLLVDRALPRDVRRA